MQKKKIFTIRLRRQGIKHKPIYHIVLTERKMRVQSGKILYRLGYYDPCYKNGFFLNQKKNLIKFFFFDFSILFKSLLKDTKISYKVAILIAKLFFIDNKFLYEDNKNIFITKNIFYKNNICGNSNSINSIQFMNDFSFPYKWRFSKNNFLEKNRKRVWNYSILSYSFFFQVNETLKYRYLNKFRNYSEKRKKLFRFPTLSIFIKLLFNTFKFNTKNLDKSVFFFKKSFENFRKKKIKKKVKYPRHTKYAKKKKKKFYKT